MPTKRFLFRLCGFVGCQHPKYLKLDSKDLSEWQAAWNDRPFGFDVDHYLLAQIAQMIAAGAGQSYAIDECMPHSPEAADELELQQLDQMADSIEEMAKRKADDPPPTPPNPTPEPPA